MITTYWAIGITADGCHFRCPFDSKKAARTWAAEHHMVIARFLECHNNLNPPVFRLVRDEMQLEG